jgi:curved DNA-binding protein
MATEALDYYEFLQISPNADFETIHRVYRFLAARFHPDNPDSGDPEKFYVLKTAYDVLSDPAQRAKYDAECAANEPEKQPMSSTVDFMDNMQGELNRRLAVLAVLYYQRRTNPYDPEVSLADIEKRMGFPRDYLDFTTWYLSRKGYITKADNSDFALTAEGVDFVEAQRVSIPVLNKLLTSGAEAAVSAAAQASISALDPSTPTETATTAVSTPVHESCADETPATDSTATAPVISEAEVADAAPPDTKTKKGDANKALGLSSFQKSPPSPSMLPRRRPRNLSWSAKRCSKIAGQTQRNAARALRTGAPTKLNAARAPTTAAHGADSVSGSYIAAVLPK